MSKIRNPILATDSYKVSHFAQYPERSEYVTSYIEARGSKIEGVTEVVFFGLRAFINDFLRVRVTKAHINEAEQFFKAHGTPFNRIGWERVVEVHNGYLPVEIQAVPEGTPVTLKNVMLQLTNTDPLLPWVTSYIETLLLSYIWYGSSVATKSREIKKVIKRYLDETSDNPEAELPFKLHDFGYRGAVPGGAGLGAAAHLINFLGTDTIAGIEFAMEHYDAGVCGFSISASEHSTMTSWGRDYEYAAYANMVKQYAKPGVIFACVIDSFDTMEAIRMWAEPYPNGKGAPSLLDQVKEAGACVVLRPDSGDPVQMPVSVIKELMKYVGKKENSKGFFVLPDHVRVIQGDGIDMSDVGAILWQLKMNRISASNIAFGMGGGLLQKVDRDTFKFAMKANEIVIDGAVRNVVKDPVTDPGKKSKEGSQMLLRHPVTGEFRSVPWRGADAGAARHQARLEGFQDGIFNVVYRHEESSTDMYVESFDEIRKNAEVK